MRTSPAPIAPTNIPVAFNQFDIADDLDMDEDDIVAIRDRDELSALLGDTRLLRGDDDGVRYGDAT